MQVGGEGMDQEGGKDVPAGAVRDRDGGASAKPQGERREKAGRSVGTKEGR